MDLFNNENLIISLIATPIFMNSEQESSTKLGQNTTRTDQELPASLP